MKDTPFLFWWRWLVAATAAVGVFGLSLVLLPGPMQQVFNWLYFGDVRGLPTVSPEATVYLSFVFAVLGAVTVGWAASLWLALWGPFRRGEAEGWQMVALSLAVWYGLDTPASLWWGFWQNAVLNTVILVAYLIPLAATYGRLGGGRRA